MFEQTGDRQLSAWEAGILTRRYGRTETWSWTSSGKDIPVPQCVTLWRDTGWKVNYRRPRPPVGEALCPAFVFGQGIEVAGAVAFMQLLVKRAVGPVDDTPAFDCRTIADVLRPAQDVL